MPEYTIDCDEVPRGRSSLFRGPTAVNLYDHLLVLPVHRGLRDKHIELICETLMHISYSMTESRARHCEFVGQNKYVDAK